MVGTRIRRTTDSTGRIGNSTFGRLFRTAHTANPNHGDEGFVQTCEYCLYTFNLVNVHAPAYTIISCMSSTPNEPNVGLEKSFPLALHHSRSNMSRNKAVGLGRTQTRSGQEFCLRRRLHGQQMTLPPSIAYSAIKPQNVVRETTFQQYRQSFKLQRSRAQTPGARPTAAEYSLPQTIVMKYCAMQMGNSRESLSKCTPLD